MRQKKEHLGKHWENCIRTNKLKTEIKVNWRPRIQSFYESCNSSTTPLDLDRHQHSDNAIRLEVSILIEMAWSTSHGPESVIFSIPGLVTSQKNQLWNWCCACMCNMHQCRHIFLQYKHSQPHKVSATFVNMSGKGGCAAAHSQLVI